MRSSVILRCSIGLVTDVEAVVVTSGLTRLIRMRHIPMLEDLPNRPRIWRGWISYVTYTLHSPYTQTIMTENLNSQTDVGTISSIGIPTDSACATMARGTDYAVNRATFGLVRTVADYRLMRMIRACLGTVPVTQ